MTRHLLRTFTGFVLALAAASVLRFVLFDLGPSRFDGDASLVSVLGSSFASVFVYGLPLAALAVVTAELLRLRHPALQIVLGILVAFLAAHIETRGQSLSEVAETASALTGPFLLAIGVVSALIFWSIAGRRAGWRGENVERAEKMAVEAFRTASANAQTEYCRACLVGVSAIGVLLFSLFGWITIELFGLKDGLVDETEAQGRTALKNAGHSWAVFKVNGSRGILEGTAPDEVQKLDAYNIVRASLDSVIGFPGVLSQIDNKVSARSNEAAVNEQLADAARREREAKLALESAREATEAARAAEEEAKRRVETQAQAAEAELKRRLEEQAKAAEAEIKRRIEEQARAAEAARVATEAARVAEEEAKRNVATQAQATEAELKRRIEEHATAAEAVIKRKLEEQAMAAEAEIKRRLEEQQAKAAEQAAAAEQARAADQARAAAEEARRTAVATTEKQVEVAAVTPAEGEAADTTQRAESAKEPATETSAPVSSGACSSQDLAIIESSRILFEKQRFEVTEEAAGELDRIAASAQACAPRPVLVSGHADANSDSLFNRSLGLQRAEAIRTALIARGLPETLVFAQSSGTEYPIDNDPLKGDRELNRRAEFRFLEASEVTRDATLDPEQRANTCERELTEIMSQSIIHFPTASARISEQSFGLIRKLATGIQKCGSVIVTVEGHTDRTGDPTYNQNLSEMRAAAVREALVTAGADQTRLAAKGFASSRPYDPSETAAAFALNRRIEFKVSGKFSSSSTRGP